MKELLVKINAEMETFRTNADKNVNEGNKAAGKRARKASLQLEKLFKEYRRESVKAEK